MKKLIKKIKGFTLIELLAVLVILAILVAVAVPTVTKYLNDTRKKTYKDNASIAIDAVRKDIVLGNINREGVTVLSGNTKKYSLGAINDLLEKKLVKTSYNTNYDTEKSYIIVSQGTDGTYAFDVCLTDEDHKHTLKSNSLDVDSFVLSEEECDETSSGKTILSMYKSNDLHIGDFITYDAGTWTASEIASIQVGPNSSLVSANNSTLKPTTTYQFGGFVAGRSRNVGAVENLSFGGSDYVYAKMYDGNNSSNQAPISGWRIFDIDEENEVVTLISAANPEDYYQPSSSTSNGAYISQYILTGTKNSSWTATNVESSYTKRDWSMYENSAYNASNARVLTKTDLDNWYNKYMGVTNADTYTQSTFRRIYSSPYLAYQNLIDNHAYYWLGSAHGLNFLYFVEPRYRYVNRDDACAFGVRVLVSIPLTSTVQDTAVTTRTVTLDGMQYYNSGTASYYGPETVQEYNVWELEEQ